MGELVTVAVFTWAQEMAVVRARLEWEGIRCFTCDENTIGAQPFYSNLLGGIKLQVPSTDAERARAMLKEWGCSPSSQQSEEDVDELARSASFDCPYCGSDNTRQEGFSMRALVWAMLFSGILIPIRSSCRFCFNCRKYFKITKATTGLKATPSPPPPARGR